MTKTKEEIKDNVSGAKAHIKSILAGLKKYSKGSPSERGYIQEHLTKLTWYLNRI